MGSVKENCRFIPTQPHIFRISGVHPSWEMQPDYIQAVRSLDAFNLWVCEVVLPIAFQWIEEHKKDVYSNIPEQHVDDVGVVINQAFELIKALPAYQEGLALAQDYEKRVTDGPHDPSAKNPVWKSMCDAMEQSNKAIKASYIGQLGETLR